MSDNFPKRSLRPRQSINYLEMVQNKSSPVSNSIKIPSPYKNEVKVLVPKYSGNDSDGSDESFNLDEENSDSESEFFKQSRKRKVVSEKLSLSLLERLAETEDVDEENEYRRQRQKNVADRLNILRTMDFVEDVKEITSDLHSFTPPTKPHKVAPKRPKVEQIPVPRRTQPPRRSKTRRGGSDNFFHKSIEIDTSSNESLNLPENLKIIENGENTGFLDQLQTDLDIHDSASDFIMCDFDKFCALLKSFVMFENPIKIITSRITSLAFHSSEMKLFLIAGDKQGYVSLWDICENDGVSLQAHEGSVHCVSFSSRDPNKFYTTSLDGCTRKGDITSNNLQLIYSSLQEKSTGQFHTTWHHELGDTLMIAKGDGVVKLVDMRSATVSHSNYKCHLRSVRTVESHPLNENYFLTSSGSGVFGIWDLRNIKAKEPTAVLIEDLGKALSSAFYSSTGSYVLTTSADDTIRIYDCRNDESVIKMNISHNNHGGRWLTPFKARWQPKREDCFYVGSLLTSPKRIQAYDCCGKILKEFTSSVVDTFSPVLSIHPSKPVLVGGNASGRIHVFSPFKNLTEMF